MANEEKIYNDLLYNAPNETVSNATAQSGNTLSKVERTSLPNNYNNTYSGKLDNAINTWLHSRGFEYDPAKDKAYQQYKQEYEQNASFARDTSLRTTNQLAGGFKPTYADTVASEVYNSQMDNVRDAEPAFKQLAEQSYLARQNQLANAVNTYSALDSTEYARGRDNVSDYKSYLNLLANRYATDRQSDASVNAANAEIYGTRLAGAQSNLEDARNAQNSRYLYNTVSADQRAELAQAERENAQKIAYNKAKDAYDIKVAAAKEKAQSDKNYLNKNKNARGSEYIKMYRLDEANPNFQLKQIAIGYSTGKIDDFDVSWIANKLGLSDEVIAEAMDAYDRNKNAKEWEKGYR